ncbi:MAG TPA: hypothetical protein DF698_04630 [Candidatus Atribacteria bacterium]|nr:hypothetical protein [Candidatus Atribacteria bacterium]
MLLIFLERQSMFKRKKALPTWIQNVDLGQKRVYDRNWVFVITISFLFLVVLLLGTYSYPSSVDDYQVFERVKSILLLPK